MASDGKRSRHADQGRDRFDRNAIAPRRRLGRPLSRFRRRAARYRKGDNGLTRGSGRVDDDGRASLRDQPSCVASMVLTAEATAKDCRSAARRRRDAAKRYRPDRVHLLIVAQMPPYELDRYFYFPRVPKADYLFQAVVPHLLGEEPARLDKRAHLAALRDLGVFIIDLKPDPCNPAPVDSFVDDLVARVRGLDPQHIVLVKVDVYDAAFQRLRALGLPVIDARVPFPSTGQQTVFGIGFRSALGEAGLPSRAPVAA
jgi:hypothetical protein